MVLTRICGRSPISREESRNKIVWIVVKGERIAVELSPILINNGYPEAVINAVTIKKINQFHRPTQLGPKKCPLYLHLPWLGNVSMRYEMQIKTAVKRCYFAVEPCIVYTTRQLLPVAKKDVLPAFHQSNIVYQFLCHCDSRYVGRTSQRLQQRIKQHVSKTILQEHNSQDRSTLAHSCKPIRSFKAETSFSAIGQHLLQNSTCAREYNDNKFSILARGRTSFHLSTLEARYIKTSKPNLCKQKELVYDLKITH